MNWTKVLTPLLIFLAVQTAPAQTGDDGPDPADASFVSEGESAAPDPTGNMLFDSYDEIIIQNFEKENLTHIKFVGNVKIRFDGNMLKARTVIITTRENTVLDISAFDKVEFLYEGNTYLATFLSFNPETKRGQLKNVRSYLGGGSSVDSGNPFSAGTGTYYKAKKVNILENNRIVMEDVYFTFTAAEFPHYEFFAQRLWYYKGEVIYALFDSYAVGQAHFIWFPFFMRWEKFSGLRTSFGREKRIGWYLMNSIDLEFPYGNYAVGLDLYERMGQYLNVRFQNKGVLGVFNSLNVNFEGANDNRLFYDRVNDRYSRFITVDNQVTNISQLSWHYTVNGSIAQSDTSISFRWEDLNDPFFIGKYSYRREKFDIQDILQYYNNYFYNHDDSSPSHMGFGRSFALSYKNFNLSGQWAYTRTVNPAVSNIYVNDRYQYYLSSVVFPSMSYRFDHIDFFNDVNYTVPSGKTLTISNTNIRLALDEDPEKYLSRLEITNVMTVETNGSGVTRREKAVTNRVPLELAYGISTNQFKLWSFSSGFDASIVYSPSENLDTNGKAIYDKYEHSETVSVGLSGAFLDGLVNWGNSLSFYNLKRWSTFTNEKINNDNASGSQVDYGTSLGTGYTFELFRNSLWKISFPLSVSHSFNYQLFRSIANYAPRNASHATSAGTGVSVLEGQIAWSLSASHAMTYRITNGVEDVYIDNLTARSLSASTSLKVFWLSMGTGLSLDILDTKTNIMRWDLTGITNRIPPGYGPKLSVSFAPPAEFLPMPTVTYLYDILRQTNVNLNVSTSYSVAKLYRFIFYEIEALNFSSALNWDFLSPRSTTFSMSFGTTIWFSPTWRMNFSTSVLNNRIYRYFRENAPIYNEPYVEFWKNLYDSVNIIDYEALKRGFFKIQGFHFDLVHYLNEWEMTVNFDLFRRVDEMRMLSYWEPNLKIEFKLSGTSDQFPPYEKKFVPEQYQ